MDFDRLGFDKEVGIQLQTTRNEKRLTQEALALQIGIPRATYANIEKGRQRVPVDVIWRAAIVLGVDVATLLPKPLHGYRRVSPVIQPGTGMAYTAAFYPNVVEEENPFVQRGRQLNTTATQLPESSVKGGGS